MHLYISLNPISKALIIRVLEDYLNHNRMFILEYIKKIRNFVLPRVVHIHETLF